MDEVAARAVGAEPTGVVGPAELRLVLGVARENSQVLLAVSKLALVPVLTEPVLLEWPAELGLVAVGGALARLLGLLHHFHFGIALVHDDLDRTLLGGHSLAPRRVGARPVAAGVVDLGLQAVAGSLQA